MSSTNANANSRIVTNVPRSSASIIPQVLLELNSRQRLRVDDPGDRPDLVDDDLPEDVEVVGLDLRDEVVLPEQGVELHDLLDFEELVVHLVLLGGSSRDEDEADGQPESPVRCGNRITPDKAFHTDGGSLQNPSNLRARAT